MTATIIIGAVVAAAVVAVLWVLIRALKQGNAIGSGCVGCPNQPYCHRKSVNGCTKNPHSAARKDKE